MAQTIPEKVLNYVACTQEILKRAQDRQAKQTKVASDTAGKIKVAVDALVKNDRITEGQKDQAAELLRDPVQALDLIAKVAAHRNTEELGNLGTPVDSGKSAVKTAGFYDGQTFEMRESDRVLLEGLGLIN